jgi:hypothetical protein
MLEHQVTGDEIDGTILNRPFPGNVGDRERDIARGYLHSCLFEHPLGKIARADFIRYL